MVVHRTVEEGPAHSSLYRLLAARTGWSESEPYVVHTVDLHNRSLRP